MDIGVIAAWSASGVAVASAVYGVLIERFKLEVREFELAFPNLPSRFDGYRILHLSDLHIFKLGRLEQHLMRITSSRPVDTCVFTGDVTASQGAANIFHQLCSAIPCQGPIFMVPGNSEHKPWVDTGRLLDALAFDGLQILVNSSQMVRRDGESIRFVGVDDAYSKLARVGEAFKGVDPAEFIVFLTHCPSAAPDGIRLGADLILAGHTHGGQIRFPFVGAIWTHMHRHKPLSDGLYTPDTLSAILGRDIGTSILFVSRGVGTSRIPIRFNCPPEIAYITLKKEPHGNRNRLMNR